LTIKTKVYNQSITGENTMNRNIIHDFEQADVIEIDSIFVGKNFSVNVDEEEFYDVDASYVDDDNYNKYEWYFDHSQLQEAEWNQDRQVWIIEPFSANIDGELIVIRMWKLQNLT
jgi:hypothetical protein